MGTGGAGSFDNDAAMDWVANHLKDPASLRSALRRGPDAATVAAASVVAACLGKPEEGTPDAVTAWVDANRAKLPPELAAEAGAAVDRVRTRSELKDARAGDLRWKEAMDALYRRLVDEDRANFLTKKILDRLERAETSLLETVLIATVKKAAEDKYPDVTPLEVRGLLQKLAAKGRARYSARKWSR